jgi:hypothetical protein
MLDGCQDVVAVVGIWSRERIIVARCGRQVGLRKELQDAGAELVLLESRRLVGRARFARIPWPWCSRFDRSNRYAVKTRSHQKGDCGCATLETSGIAHHEGVISEGRVAVHTVQNVSCASSAVSLDRKRNVEREEVLTYNVHHARV